MTPLGVFEEFRFIVELLCAEFIFVPPAAQRRSRFALRAICGWIFCMGFSLCYFLVVMADEAWVSENLPLQWATYIGWYVVLTVLSLAYMAFCYKLSFGWLLFVGIAGYALQHIEYTLVNEMLALGVAPTLRDSLWLYIPVCAATYAALCVPVAIFFRRKLRELGDVQFAGGVPFLCFYSILLVMLIASAFTAQALFLNGGSTVDGVDSPYYAAAFGDVLNCIFVLIILYAFCCVRERDRRNDIINQLLYDAGEQYRLKKETIDIINGKCHDLKHQIAALRGMPAEEREARLADMEDLIMIYDSSIDLGNEALNVIVTDKMLYCAKNNIRLNVAGSGKDLGFMDTVDIYTLLGNALDNAVESAMRLEDKEKRCIDFSVSEQGEIVLIRTDNFYEGKLTFRDGLPLTGKADVHYHGFGLMSIRKIAEKYGGTVDICAENSVFTLQVVIPMHG